ncbi:hypothetical protein H9649_02075 [Sporosarcina sp. Sa2YVA2]|uniref:DUF4129 domain-containing protein n=1 Tax=Sporosarcina quadrami TaxID=2762234 RepID=A0ABR8U6K2_9BACL|nr:hypothetical protein [Sporosarcina quadrami]MBD7983353.1 hypothetical protein [Sporosarcina quadrami]
MEEARREKNWNQFNYSERLVVELFLLAYVFAFFLGETNSDMAYFWFAISVIGGIASYFIFNGRNYTIGLGGGVALVLTVPLLLFGVPLLNFLIFFAYTLWRIQANFNRSRIKGWPFLTINTLVFFLMASIARLLFVYGNPDLLVNKQIIVYLLSSFLYFFIRMITIWVNSKQLGNFKLRDANKAFGKIISLAALVFVLVFTFLKPIRLGILISFGFVFHTVFRVFGEVSSPMLDYIREEAERVEEEEEQDYYMETRMQDELLVSGTSVSPFEIAFYSFIFVVLISIIINLIRKRQEKKFIDLQDDYSLAFKGKKAKEKVKKQMLYDYSAAKDEVRKKFEKFELVAKSHNYTRSHSETITEWFSRMGWQEYNFVCLTYNDVRYGLHNPTNDELDRFNQELRKLTERFSEKE